MAGEVADGLEGWAVRLKLLPWRERAEVEAGLLLFFRSTVCRGWREVSALYRLTGWGVTFSFESRLIVAFGVRCMM
jgi:hypothetical protein